jgi:hypothetical protein
VSSAILYLAIVAIWAGFLVPAWLRRPHAAQEQGSAELSAPQDLIETDYVHVTHHEAQADVAASVPEPDGLPSSTEPSQSRKQMLRARRRMLTILVAITLVTCGFAYMGLVKWWICAPPTGMLVLYVLLLREVAKADAELARKRAEWEQAQASAYEQYLRAEAERGVYEVGVDNSGAQIIDISGRVSDELYDQYADAAVRAVGD